MLSGLPASGKSTRAKELVETGGNWVRVNRDLLREMLHCGKWSGRNEGVTVEVEKIVAINALKNGLNVVVDDTNLNPKNRDMWKSVADAAEAEFTTEKIMTHYSECVVRDSEREKKVGRDVIVPMALQYGLYEKPAKGFVVCDLDGTLCDITHRLHFVKSPEDADGNVDFKKDWKSFFAGIHADEVRKDVRELVRSAVINGHEIILVSARPDTYRKETIEWLDRNLGIDYSALIMRKATDKRPDTEVKQEIFDTYFKDKYPIEVVIDDRPSVIRMWRANNLNVVDVGGGVEF